MRTFEEIKASVADATVKNNAELLLGDATELDSISTPEATALAARSRGWALFLRGDYTAALEHDHSALAIYEELGDRSGVARVTGNIGIVHRITGNYPAALEHFHYALVMHEEFGDSRSVAGITNNIGILHGSTGNYPVALVHFHRALEINEDLGNRSWVAINTSNIGSVHKSTGDYRAALEHFHRALALHKELDESSGVAGVTGNMLVALLDSGEHAEAAALLQTMDALQIDDPGVVIQREASRATLQEHHGNIDEAAATLREALLISQEHTLAPLQAELHKALRDLALKRNDLASYVEHNNEFTRITEEINGKDTATKLAMQEKQREIDAREKEHQQHMAVLHSTLPKHIADRVARGEVVNDHFENASVIFLDIVGFTSISDRIPSGHVVHLLEQIFTTLDMVCERNDVVKIKTIGDSYMAVSFESVVNAATCALDMIASLDALEITMPPSLGDTSWTKGVGDIKVRIGIHCGPITAGVIGTARMQYDVWGDTVNVASRMESSGEAGRIHVSQVFAANLEEESRIKNQESNQESREVPLVTRHSSLVTIERGSFDIKGKGPITTYWLERIP